MSSKKASDATTTEGAQAPNSQTGKEAAQSADSAAVAIAVGGDSALANAEETRSPKDENHGRGGLYQRNADGSRTLIERTRRADESVQGR